MTPPLAQEQVSAARRLCRIYKHKNREAETWWCDLTDVDVSPSTRRQESSFYFFIFFLKDWYKTLGSSFLLVDSLRWCLVVEA